MQHLAGMIVVAQSSSLLKTLYPLCSHTCGRTSDEHGVPGSENSHVLMEQPDTPLLPLLTFASAAGPD